jgi:hypothetical protein
MPSIPFESVDKNINRAIVVTLGSIALLPLGFVALAQFRDLPTAVKIAGAVGVFVAYGTAFTLGMRKWALTRVRYVLDDGGLSVFTLTGQLHARVRWDEMQEYVIDTRPFGPRMRFLSITRRHGGPLEIVEMPNPAQRRAFGAFCKDFVAAVGQRQAEMPRAAIREGVSFYDTTAARVLGVGMLVMIVVMVAISFFLPAGERGDLRPERLVLLMVIMTPFIYRTVFRRKPLAGPDIEANRIGTGR